MKTISIHQSQYLPWPPYFKKIFLSDEFVVMDNVQFQKNGVQNRNKIRNKTGEFWITLPVNQKLDENINEKKIVQLEKNLKKHWIAIMQSYSKSPNWKVYDDELYEIYNSSYNSLFELNHRLLNFICERIDITTKITLLSDLQIESKKNELIIDICKKTDATHYLSGTGGNYIDLGEFNNESIDITYLKSVPPKYNQKNELFIEGLSMLDYMMYVSKEEIQLYFKGA